MYVQKHKPIIYIIIYIYLYRWWIDKGIIVKDNCAIDPFRTQQRFDFGLILSIHPALPSLGQFVVRKPFGPPTRVLVHVAMLTERRTGIV